MVVYPGSRGDFCIRYCKKKGERMFQKSRRPLKIMDARMFNAGKQKLCGAATQRLVT